MSSMVILLLLLYCNVVFSYDLVTFRLNDTYNDESVFNLPAMVYIPANIHAINDNCGISIDQTENSITSFCNNRKNKIILSQADINAELYNVDKCTVAVYMTYRLLGQLGSESAAELFILNIEYFVNTLLLDTSNIGVFLEFQSIQYIQPYYSGIHDALSTVNTYTPDTCASLLIDNGDFLPVVGLAYVGSACESGYKGFVVSTQQLELASRIVAHEFGHVLGAVHDTTQCGTGIMNPYISQSLTTYTQCSIDAIESNLDGYTCMIVGNYSTDSNNNNYNDPNSTDTIPAYAVALIIVFSTVIVFIFSIPIYHSLSATPHTVIYTLN